MYTITFYSFKGGVGRTMALANVAAILTGMGRRVLVVDFDLEAPGLPSYEPFRGLECKNGVVDFVHEYLRTNISPNVGAFVAEASIGGKPIWIMPAGSHTSTGYSTDLSTIDWVSLYRDRSGFLLMEDLKQQWAAFEGHGFDYVLIDSRTGHTDVGGICTRQLPDAVVAMFVPTRQNLEGLAPIVRAIKAESAPVRKRIITLHYCPSNVPDIDDENDILRGLLQEAKTTLDYISPAATINHYSHLEILEQKIFAVAHAKSRLGKQYSQLTKALIAENLRDRDGALITLERLPAQFDAARREGDTKVVDRLNSKATVIRKNFSDDGEIAFSLARAADKMIRPEEEIASLTVAIDQGFETNWAQLRRAFVYSSLGRDKETEADLKAVILSKDVKRLEATPALDFLRTLLENDPEQLEKTLFELARAPDLDDDLRGRILQNAIRSRKCAEDVLEIVTQYRRSDEDAGSRLFNVHVCALIALGRFAKAIDILGGRTNVLKAGDVAQIFNLAIAEWGLHGEAPRDLFNEVKLFLESRATHDANARQCFALTLMVCGEREAALSELREARQAIAPLVSSFSCWQYLERYEEEFEQDLDDMEIVFRSDQPIRLPIFS
ncbi:AAA family ATPase [Sphingomonas sp. So64.6b]|uniref:tyrosine-protein kinase family protein n=1 Tax=Sphingomonas sp. So64.6b TaxID=2997354 RepID=UPI001602C9DB|nr:AAA family ATPase [Sphingomonas sp. So64.6b]QNA85286.1 AAA family ATPase [Sphingomonas sp. So64.6b]